jgi:hypothetical protein
MEGTFRKWKWKWKFSAEGQSQCCYCGTMYTHYTNVCNHLKSTIEGTWGRKYHQQK